MDGVGVLRKNYISPAVGRDASLSVVVFTTTAGIMRGITRIKNTRDKRGKLVGEAIMSEELDGWEPELLFFFLFKAQGKRKNW